MNEQLENKARDYENPFKALGLATKFTRGFWQEGGTPELLNMLAEDQTLTRQMVLLLMGVQEKNYATKYEKPGARSYKVGAEVKMNKILKLEKSDITIFPFPAPMVVGEYFKVGSKIGEFTIGHETKGIPDMFPQPLQSISPCKVQLHEVLPAVAWDSFMVAEIAPQEPDSIFLDAASFFSLILAAQNKEILRHVNTIVPIMIDGKKYTGFFSFFGPRLNFGIDDYDKKTWTGMRSNYFLSRIPRPQYDCE